MSFAMQTPVQAMESHRQYIEKEKRITAAFNRANNIKPPLHDATPEELAMARSVYGVRLRPLPPIVRVYDRVHSVDPTWAMKVKKDDYRNLTMYGKNARMDEDNREIPVITNAEYGHRLHSPPEKFKRSNVRVNIYHETTFRKNGIPFSGKL